MFVESSSYLGWRACFQSGHILIFYLGFVLYFLRGRERRGGWLDRGSHRCVVNPAAHDMRSYDDVMIPRVLAVQARRQRCPRQLRKDTNAPLR
jgi:hypothetical protein